MKSTHLIAVSGGSGSGKTTAAKMLQQHLGVENCKILSQDNYYKDQSKHFHGDGSVNFDAPQAIDFSLMGQHLQDLLRGKTIDVPIYDFVTHRRKAETHILSPAKYIIVDGTLILFPEEMRPLFDQILFLEIAEDLRFSRRLKRDVQERGRTIEGVHTQFYQCVKPMHDLYVAPLSIYAHYVIYNNEEMTNIIKQLILALP